MSNQNPLLDLSVRDLKRVIKTKERIERLQARLAQLLGGAGSQTATPAGRRRTMSAAGRARIAAAARARWAKFHAAKNRAGKAPAKRKRKVSAAARARLSALAKARWAKARRAGRSRL